MEVATYVWHHEPVDQEKAMTDLLEAVADVKGRVGRLAAALYEADKAGIRQNVLVAKTGYNRETIRRHIEDEKIRRGEMDPTPRYLAAQRRAAKNAGKTADGT
jgi:hypothetical protein